MGSAVQRMAMQCWCLHFQSQDHSFLLQSNMFSNISKALSGTEDAEGGGSGNSEKRTKVDKVHIWIKKSNKLSLFIFHFLSVNRDYSDGKCSVKRKAEGVLQ